MAAFFGSDCPGAAYVLRPRSGLVILALSMRTSDGMDRRKVQYVEVHRCYVRDHRLAVAQRAVERRIRRAGSRKDFVPGRVTGLLPVDDDLQEPPITAGKPSLRIAL